MTNQVTLHVTFNRFAAHKLRQVLARSEQRDLVRCCPDDLSYGPIHPYRVTERLEFIRARLHFGVEPTLHDDIDEFWNEVANTTAPVTAWLSRRCMQDYTGFLELLTRRAAPPLVVDVADRHIEGTNETLRSFWRSMGDDSSLADRLHELAVPLSHAELRDDHSLWARLRSENGALRVYEQGRIVSAELSYFDETILSCLTDEWQTCAEVVGDTIYKVSSAAVDHAAPDLIWSRLGVLGEDEAVDLTGDESSIMDSWVRRRRMSKA